MEQPNLIEEPTTASKKPRSFFKLARKYLWPWVTLQVLVGAAALMAAHWWHIPYKIVMPCQWTAIVTIFYLQFRHMPVRGIPVTFSDVYFHKWGFLIVERRARTAALIYKIETNEAGEVVCWVWRLQVSKRKWFFFMKACLIRFYVFIQIIK